MERCDEVRAAIADGTLHVHTELDAHIQSCTLCQELTSAHQALGPSVGDEEAGDHLDPDRAFAALSSALEKERGLGAWLRHQRTSTRRSVLGGLLVLIFVAFSLAKTKRALEPFEFVHRHVGFVVLLSLILGAMWLTLSPAHRPWASTRLRRGLILASGVVALAVGLMPTSGWWTDASSTWVASVGLPCLAFGLVVAVPVYLLVRLFDRNPAGPSMITAALVAGLAGDLALHLRCLHRESQHFLLGHFAVILIALMAAALWSGMRPSTSTHDSSSSQNP